MSKLIPGIKLRKDFASRHIWLKSKENVQITFLAQNVKFGNAQISLTKSGFFFKFIRNICIALWSISTDLYSFYLLSPADFLKSLCNPPISGQIKYRSCLYQWRIQSWSEGGFPNVANVRGQSGSVPVTVSPP